MRAIGRYLRREDQTDICSFVNMNFHVKASFVAVDGDPGTLDVGCAAHFRLKRKEAKIGRFFFRFEAKKNFFFALSETLQESENNESETKILSEKFNSLKVIFKYLVLLQTFAAATLSIEIDT
jgi:hypothetical protein